MSKAAVDPQLEAAHQRIDELARAYAALQNDREEFKQRLSRERERLIDIERGQVALALVETIDELDLSLKNADHSPLAKGVQLIRDKLINKLDHLGIERVSLVDAQFDPNIAEAADVEVTPDESRDGKVTAEMRAGYKLKDKDNVVRPARVRVARYVKPAEA